MSLQGSLSIERMCELTRLSRASFYRSFREQHPVEEEMEVRSAIQRIAVFFISMNSSQQSISKRLTRLACATRGRARWAVGGSGMEGLNPKGVSYRGMGV